ncbi:MAG: cation transporter [Rhodoglobus sp.]
MTDPTRETRLRRRGIGLEWATLGWNVVGVALLAVFATQASSVALVGFGLDSLIEIGASAVVIWELSETGEHRRAVALRLIGIAFVALAVYLVAQSVFALFARHHASPSPGGLIWTSVTAVVMFALSAAKTRTGRQLGNPVLVAEGRVTFVDGLVAVTVLVGLLLSTSLGWWWADPAAGILIAGYAAREAWLIVAQRGSS